MLGAIKGGYPPGREYVATSLNTFFPYPPSDILSEIISSVIFWYIQLRIIFLSSFEITITSSVINVNEDTSTEK